MNEDEKIAIDKSREYIVSKSNQIVQKCRYDFSVTEQRTIAYICSKIKPIEILDRTKGTPFNSNMNSIFLIMFELVAYRIMVNFTKK